MWEKLPTWEENQQILKNQKEVAWKLLKEVKKSWNYEIFDKMISEYKKLNFEKIKTIYKNRYKQERNQISLWNKISYREYQKIKNAKVNLEKTHELYSSAKDWKIEKWKWLWTKLQEWIANSLYTEWKLTRENFLMSDSLKTLNKKELWELQQIQINKILWNDKWFNSEYLQWFSHNKWWNYLIKISEFETKYNNLEVQDLNSLELWNYIQYLSEKNNKKSKKIINQIRLKLWPDTKFFDELPTKSFIENIFDEVEASFNEFINNLFKFNNIDDFTNNFSSESKEEQAKIIKHLKDVNGKHRKDFIESIQNSLPENKNEDERLEIATTFVNDLIKTPELENILLKIEVFETKNKVSINKKEVTQNTLKNQQQNTQIEVLKAIQKWDIRAEKIARAKLQKINYNTNIVNIINNNQIESITNRLQNWESFDNVIRDLSQNNSELKKVLDEEKELEKSNPGVESDEENHDEEVKEHNEYNIDNDDYTPSNWGYSVQLKHWENFPWLIITPEEKKLTMWNPEALKNLVDFYQFFKDLNLEWVWKYRKELALSMWNRNININDKNAISKAELLKFWNNLIKVINHINEKDNPGVEQISKNTGTISWIQNELRKYSWANSDLSNNQTFNIKWEDKFTANLRNLWIIWWAYFHTMNFRELMT